MSSVDVDNWLLEGAAAVAALATEALHRQTGRQTDRKRDYRRKENSGWEREMVWRATYIVNSREAGGLCCLGQPIIAKGEDGVRVRAVRGKTHPA